MKWTQQNRQELIGAGKVLIGKIAKGFNATNYPTERELAGREGLAPVLANHARRLKKGDIAVAETLWVKHVYLQSSGHLPQIFENKAHTSRHAIREVGGERNRHLARKLGKLVAAGIIYGTPCNSMEYGDQYTVTGAKGYGFRPSTKESAKGFTFFWTPEFVGMMESHLPHGVKLFTWERENVPSLGLEEPATLPIHAATPRPANAPNATKSPTSVQSSQIARNEAMRLAASADAELNPEEDKKATDGRQNAGTPPGLQIAAKRERGEEIGKDAGRGAISRKLAMQGQMMLANAVLLVQMYLKKLAPHTGKAYVGTCIDTAVRNAVELLATYPADQQEVAFSEYAACIDRIEQRFQRGGGFFVVSPDKYFDRHNERSNIHAHYNHYLRPWKKRREEMDEFAAMQAAAKAQKDTGNDDWARNHSPYSGLAYSLKTHLIRHHGKTDRRLETADLHRWTAQIRAMVRVDGIPYGQAVKVAQWLLTSNDEAAHWWLKEACYGMGIRSPQSFRKHFPKIESAMISANLGKTRPAAGAS